MSRLAQVVKRSEKREKPFDLDRYLLIQQLWDQLVICGAPAETMEAVSRWARTYEGEAGVRELVRAVVEKCQPTLSGKPLQQATLEVFQDLRLPTAMEAAFAD